VPQFFLNAKCDNKQERLRTTALEHSALLLVIRGFTVSVFAIGLIKRIYREKCRKSVYFISECWHSVVGKEKSIHGSYLNEYFNE